MTRHRPRRGTQAMRRAGYTTKRGRWLNIYDQAEYVGRMIKRWKKHRLLQEQLDAELGGL